MARGAFAAGATVLVLTVLLLTVVALCVGWAGLETLLRTVFVTGPLLDLTAVSLLLMPLGDGLATADVPVFLTDSLDPFLVPLKLAAVDCSSSYLFVALVFVRWVKD